MNTTSDTLLHIIKTRRSIFPASFIAKEISLDILTQILEAANYAPSHKLTQPWRFTVIRKEAKTRLGLRMAEHYKAGAGENFLQKKYDSFIEKAAQADCILAINVQFHPDKLPAWEEVASTACAVQNMALAAHAFNIGGYWSTPGIIHHLDDFLQLNADEKCHGLFYLGYHNAPEAEAKRTPMADKINWLDV